MSFITEMDEMGDMKIENEGDLRNVVQSHRRRSLPAVAIPQSERWIPGNQDYLKIEI